MRVQKRHLGELVWIATGQLAVVVGGVAGVKVLTSLLEPAEYGDLALALTLAILSQQVWAGPLQQAVTRNIAPAVEGGSFATTLATAKEFFVVIAVAQVLVLVAGVLVLGMLHESGGGLVAALAWGVVLSVAQPVFELSQGVSVQLRRRREVAGFQAAFAVLRPAGAALAIVAVQDDASAGAAGLALATLVLAGASARKHLRAAKGGVGSPELRRSLTEFALPYAVWGVLAWAVVSGDRWILRSFADAGEVGLYVAAMQVGTLVPRLGGQFVATFVGPILNQWAGTGADAERVHRSVELLRTVLIGVGLAGILGVGVTAVYAEDIMSLLTGPGYEKGAGALPWIFGGAAMNELSQLCFAIGPLVFRPQRFLLARVSSYSVTLLIMLAMGWLWGREGMVTAFVSGAAIHLGATGRVAWKVYRESVGARLDRGRRPI